MSSAVGTVMLVWRIPETDLNNRHEDDAEATGPEVEEPSTSAPEVSQEPAGDASDDGEQAEEEEDEDDKDDFAVAWEILDLARVIYSKDDTPESRQKLADVLLCLGDVSLESGRFDCIGYTLINAYVISDLFSRKL